MSSRHPFSRRTEYVVAADISRLLASRPGQIADEPDVEGQVRSLELAEEFLERWYPLILVDCEKTCQRPLFQHTEEEAKPRTFWQRFFGWL